MEEHISPYTSKNELVGHRASARVKDLIDISFMYAIRKKLSVKDTVIDTSESHERAKRMTFRIPCISTKTDLYILGRNRTMVAEEYGALLGFGAPRIRKEVYKGSRACTDGEAKDLFAHSMAIPHVALILIASIFAMKDIFDDTNES